MKKVVITLTIILALLIGIKILSSNDQKHNQIANEEIKDVDTFFALPKEEKLSEFTKLAKVDEEKEQLSEKSLDKVKEEKETKVQSLYQKIDKETLLKEVAPKKLVTPLLAINIEEKTIAELSVGDVIQLPPVGQVTYEAVISQKVRHKNGSVSVSGNLIGDGNDKHAVILTEGKTTSYASISTPEGAFEIETVNGKGYIYSVKEIENSYVDPHKEDILHPPHDKH